jgi:hypothetical protein
MHALMRLRPRLPTPTHAWTHACSSTPTRTPHDRPTLCTKHERRFPPYPRPPTANPARRRCTCVESLAKCPYILGRSLGSCAHACTRHTQAGGVATQARLMRRAAEFQLHACGTRAKHSSGEPSRCSSRHCRSGPHMPAPLRAAPGCPIGWTWPRFAAKRGRGHSLVARLLLVPQRRLARIRARTCVPLICAAFPPLMPEALDVLGAAGRARRSQPLAIAVRLRCPLSLSAMAHCGRVNGRCVLSQSTSDPSASPV